MYPTLKKSTQVIEDCYIDEDKLIEVCKERFGCGNYHLKFKFNKWYLEVPSPLDEHTLKQCEIVF